MASNSRPICSICSSESRASGLAASGAVSCAPARPPMNVNAICCAPFRLEVDLDRALGGVHADAQHLSGLSMDASRAQVAHAPVAQPPDAAVADAHATAVCEVRPRLLARDADRPRAVAECRHPAAAQADRAARAVRARA